jgi:stage III sporulation protein AB
MLAAKIIGSILVIASSTGIGFFFGNELKYRIHDLKELRKMMVLLQGDIRYANTPLPEAISSIARRNTGILGNFFTMTSKRLYELSGKTFSQIWKESVQKEVICTSLSKKDKLQMMEFGESLGYLDKEMQMNTLELYIAQLTEEITELSKNVNEKTYLYNSLGIMSGIFVTIIMI